MRRNQKKSFSNQIEIQSPTTHWTTIVAPDLRDHHSNSPRHPRISKLGGSVEGKVRVGEVDRDKAGCMVAWTKLKLLEVQLVVWKKGGDEFSGGLRV